MTTRISTLFLFITLISWGQREMSVEDFGYRQLNIVYKTDTVEAIIRSKKGEEEVKKPILFFIQGSLARPVLKYDDQQHFAPFPFSAEVFEKEYHIVVLSKPGIPCISHVAYLNRTNEFVDTVTGLPPIEYLEKNNLSYYVERNHTIVNYLKTQDWVDTSKIVVAGHSEGSTIAVKLAAANNSITHLIYSGGTPYYSRITSIVSQDRAAENDSTSWIEMDFEYWKNTVENRFDISRDHGYNTYKGTFSFSENLSHVFKTLEIPVLVSYGTKDLACPYDDLLRIEMIENNKENIVFKSYLGLEHNYFPLLKNGSVDYSQYNWDKVATDWRNWLSK